MFNIGFGELAVICIVLIIAVGPDRMPSMMKSLGKTLRTLRQASRDIRASTGIDELMRDDFDYAPPRKPYVAPVPPPPAAAEPIVSRVEDPHVIAGPAATLPSDAPTGDPQPSLPPPGPVSPAAVVPEIVPARPVGSDVVPPSVAAPKPPPES
ncbi:MAG TPA: twin-arginine translocase TatA/TatE family subunit [Polyangiales bacterium]|nr:twin-arginine translocase TatA/TatE family subunit [Polyangiales bacterium]